MSQRLINLDREGRLDFLDEKEWRCFYCGAFLQWRDYREDAGLETDESLIAEVDHRIPSARGGTDFEGNLVASCRRCNRMKGNKNVPEFRAYIAIQRQKRLEELADTLKEIARHSFTPLTEHLINIAHYFDLIRSFNLLSINPEDVVFWGETPCSKEYSVYDAEAESEMYDGLYRSLPVPLPKPYPTHQKIEWIRSM